MAKSRKGRNALKGGVGTAPAGRGGFADQLFQAREMGRTSAAATEYDSMPDVPQELDPTPDNRYIENFQTVGEDLRSSMAVNPADNAKRDLLRSMADSMTRMIDELARETDPEMKTRMVQALKAYQDAYKSQSPDQQQALLAMVDPRRRDEVAKVYGRDAIVDYEQGGQINLPFMDRTPSEDSQIVRAARATVMDMAGDEDRYSAIPRDPGSYVRPYYATERGSSQERLLGSLLDEGVDPSDISSAMLGDAALTPYTPAPGVILDRDSAPASSMLSSLIGGNAATGFRPNEIPNQGAVGRELLSQYDAIVDRGGDPVMANPYGPPMVGDDVIQQPRYGGETGDAASDAMTSLQMKSEIQKKQEALFQRAFGMKAMPGEMDLTPAVLSQEDVARIGQDFDLSYFAPWSESMIQQVAPDGSIVHADWRPDQILATIFNQTRFLAESPQLRDAAFQQLLPQVASALEKRKASGVTFNRRYDRNAAGKQLLQEEGGNLSKPAPRPVPTGPTPQQIKDALRKSLEKRNSQSGDMGFSNPHNVPRYMAGAMPNRLLSSLIG